MQILEMNDKILAFDLNLQIAYLLTITIVFVGVVSLAIGVLSQQTMNGNIKENGSKLIKMSVLCFVLLNVMLVYIVTYTLNTQSENLQYKAIVTDIAEVNQKGYTIIEHVEDDVYLIEKTNGE